MSGIVGIWNIDGAPIDRALLGRMTDFMTFRGPDAQKIWIDSETGSVGFGHTLLKTTFEAEFESHPFTLDGKVWIVADVRVDVQDDMIAKLNAGPGTVHTNIDLLTNPKKIVEASGVRRQASGIANVQSQSSKTSSLTFVPYPLSPDVCALTPDPCPLTPLKKGSVTDVELILRAYHLWGEDCVEHLLGDFAFAIWDGPNKKLFCARDHMGVKPFFYAHIGQTVIFSNTLDCVRQHRKVSDELNDLAIADFLLFEINADLATTSFADIRRVPPAHTLAISENGAERVRRYWRLEPVPELRWKSESDCVERFSELFAAAVGDRMRTGAIAVPMSGGMDSSSVAAMAKQVAERTGQRLELHAHTFVYDRLLPDQERFYSGLVAEHLKIPIHHQVLDDYRLFERWDEPGFCLPEPFHNPTDALMHDHYTFAASTARVALTGEGGDPVFCPSGSHLGQMLKSGRWMEALRAFQTARRILGRFPPIGIRTVFKGKKARWSPPYPDWLNPDLEQRLHLRERWRDHWFIEEATGARANFFEGFNWPGWTAWFERQDPGTTREKLEYRHPLFDIRIVEFAAGLPPVPWCVQKSLLRDAMNGLLPPVILQRWKTPLSRNGMEERAAVVDREWEAWSSAAPGLDRFVRLQRPDTSRREDLDYSLWRDLIPVSLNWWLRSQQEVQLSEGGFNESRSQERAVQEVVRYSSVEVV